jgi:hypothetical protein
MPINENTITEAVGTLETAIRSRFVPKLTEKCQLIVKAYINHKQAIMGLLLKP